MSATPEATAGTRCSAGFIAVDLGSSSGRVMLGVVSGDGRRTCALEQVHRFENVPLRGDPDAGGILAWDTTRLFDETLDGLRRAVSIARDGGIPVLGIGVDAWGVDYGRIDRNGDLLPPVKHHRGADPTMPAQSARLVDLETAYRITGVLDQAINTAHQLRQDAARNVAIADSTLLLVPDLWVYWLTGHVAAERTIASTTQLLDRDRGTWSEELTRAWGIDITLPPLVNDGHPAGRTLPAVTERIGAESPLPVFYVAGHDTASAFAATVGGQNAAIRGIVSSGSWAVAGVSCDQPILTEEARLLGFTQELGSGGRTLLVRNLSGMWLLQECMRAWSGADGSPVDVLRLVDEAALVEATAVIDVADEALQRPGDLPQRIADLCEAAGHPRPGQRAEVVRVILGSLAVAYADTVREAARLVGKGLDGIRIVGGGARNRLLCQLTANAAGQAVESGPAEASSLGIVYRLAVATGVCADMDAARALALVSEDSGGRFTSTASRGKVGR